MNDMKFDVRFHDITPNLKSGVQPVFHFERPIAGNDPNLPPKPFSVAQPGRVGTFWVPTRRLLDRDQGWSKVTQGERVTIPMFTYQTASPSKARLVAAGMRLGWLALQGLSPILDAEPTYALLMMGHECHRSNKGYDFYVGMMIRTK